MAINIISRFSFDIQILYELKIIFANHLKTEAGWKKSSAFMELLQSYSFDRRYFHAAPPYKQVLLIQQIQIYTC